MKNITRLLILVSIISITTPLLAQNNAAGLGLFGLINRNINFTYEKKVFHEASIKLGFGVLIPGKLPHLNSVINVLSDDETEGYFKKALEEIRFSAYSFTPEIRLYPKKNTPNGFYIGPYARYARYIFKSSFNSDVDYTDEFGNSQTESEVVFDLKGRIQKIGVGISIGYQTIISEKFFVDFNLVGPGLMYVNAKSNVISPNFPSEESISEFVKNELDVIPDIFGDIDVEALSDIEAKGTWNRILPTYRCNISIGFVF